MRPQHWVKPAGKTSVDDYRPAGARVPLPIRAVIARVPLAACPPVIVIAGRLRGTGGQAARGTPRRRDESRMKRRSSAANGKRRP
jgi:hypothetical protein